MEGKSPLYSKTLWVNLIAVVAMFFQSQTGMVIDPEYQVAILSVVNLILRLVTREPVNWKSGGGKAAILALFVSPFLMTTLVLQGCSSYSRITQDNPVLTELAVRVAVGRVLDKNPKWVEPAMAITGEAIQVIGSGDETDLQGLETFVIGKIHWTA